MVRHGETDWNLLQKYQGQTDIDLNNTGRAQANKLACYLAEHENPIEAVYCSDLSRSRETAEIIGEVLDVTPIPDPRFREIHFGAWEGLTYPEVMTSYPQEMHDWLHMPVKMIIPGGEPVQSVINRSISGIQEIAAKHEGTILVVSHGGLIKILINYLDISLTPKLILTSASMTILECMNGLINLVSVGKSI